MKIMKSQNLKSCLLIASLSLFACKTDDSTPIPTVATPTFGITPGTYLVAQNISISTTTTGASIYFTTDGSEPTSSSTLYTTPLHIYQVAGVIKAIAIKSGENNSAILSGVFSFPPLRTGQTSSSAAGDDPNHTAKGVARSYTDNGDGTVTDNATGLLWQKCSVGLSGTSCATGGATTVTFANASSQCTSLALAGKTWRLPTINELRTLTDFGAANPSINTTIFPGSVPGSYWSADAMDTSNAYTVGFLDATSYGLSKTGNNYVRCVSGSKKSIALHYVDNGDETVTDNVTGLTWQKCSSSTSGSNCATGSVTQYTWLNALNYCANLTLAGKTWRLPNANELASLADLKTNGISLTHFPGTPFSAYWTSTSQSGTANAFEIVNNIGGAVKNSGSPVRCVTGP